LQTLVEGQSKDVWVPLEKTQTGEVRLRLEILGRDYDLAREAEAVASRSAQVSAVTTLDGEVLWDTRWRFGVSEKERDVYL
jgi:hypothetical protein